MTALFYRLGPPINELDVVRSQHRRQAVSNPDDAVITVCGRCYIFGEGWPCSVARLIDVIDAQIAADRAALEGSEVRLEAETRLDEAWREAEAAAPEGWWRLRLTALASGYEAEFVTPGFTGGAFKRSPHETPAAALRALAVRLKEPQP